MKKRRNQSTPLPSSSTKTRSSLESISRMLPAGPERERFLSILAAYQKAPPDDEHLQFMEAVGYLSTIMTKVPNAIAEALRKAQSGFTDEQAAAMQERFETLLKDSIDTPSCKDLRDMVDSLKHERLQMGQQINAVNNRLGSMPGLPYCGTFKAGTLLWTGAIGLFAGAVIAGAALFTKLPDRLNFHFRQKTTADDFVDYFEDHIPELGGPVGVFVIHGNVVRVDETKGKGIVVVHLPYEFPNPRPPKA